MSEFSGLGIFAELTKTGTTVARDVLGELHSGGQIAQIRESQSCMALGDISVGISSDGFCRGITLDSTLASWSGKYIGGEMGRAVVHFEIGCRDSEKTQEFYSKLFGWKIEAMGPAAMIAAETGGIGGHITALGHEPHHYTMFYADVEDVPAYLNKAESLGGRTLVPPVEIPTGTFAWMQDPEGNTVGLWKAKKGGTK